MSDELDLDALRTSPAPTIDPLRRQEILASAGDAYARAFAKDRNENSKSFKGIPEGRRPMLVLIESLRDFVMSKQWMYAGASLAVIVVAGTLGVAYLRSQPNSFGLESATWASPEAPGGHRPITAGEMAESGARPGSSPRQQQMDMPVSSDSDASTLVAPAPPGMGKAGGGTTAGEIAVQSSGSSNRIAVQTSPAMPPMAPVPSAMPQREMARSAPNVGMASPAYPGAADVMVSPRYDEGGDQFAPFEESSLKSVASEPVSTFSVDVDTASYAFVRKMLENGVVPPPDAIRIEEMINYFPYDYRAPTSAETPFSTSVAVYPTPWNARTRILHIGIKGYEPPAGERKPANLTFLVDTSGSMQDPDKLPLLQRSLLLLLDTLDERDTISIVAYAGSAGVVLEPTPATEKAKISRALSDLAAGGSTAGSEGIELAYQVADQARVEGGVNRVVLATDGDFNVGIDDPEALKDFIAKKRESGISLSVLGFGMGNLGDDTMQVLAQNGNGNASYISDFTEARKVLVEEVGGTLETIAKDVKIQIEFNPAVVSEYRLIGYETRALNREDFNNDKVDAGDIGAGHTVTALYEIVAPGSGAELIDPLRYGKAKDASPAAPGSTEIGFLKLRYKLPDGADSRLIEVPVGADVAIDDVSRASDDMRFAAAVAAFGQKLRGSNYGTMDWEDVRALAASARGKDDGGYRGEFLRVLDDARSLLEMGTASPRIGDGAPPMDLEPMPVPEGPFPVPMGGSQPGPVSPPPIR